MWFLDIKRCKCTQDKSWFKFWFSLKSCGFPKHIYYVIRIKPKSCRLISHKTSLDRILVHEQGEKESIMRTGRSHHMHRWAACGVKKRGAHPPGTRYKKICAPRWKVKRATQAAHLTYTPDDTYFQSFVKLENVLSTAAGNLIAPNRMHTRNN